MREARAMATATRVAGDEEGDGDGGRSNGNSDDSDVNKCGFFLVRLTAYQLSPVTVEKKNRFAS